MIFKHYIKNYKKLNEGVSLDEGAVAWDDLTAFYKKADKTEIAKMERLVKNEDWDAFKTLIYKVIGVMVK